MNCPKKVKVTLIKTVEICSEQVKGQPNLQKYCIEKANVQALNVL